MAPPLTEVADIQSQLTTVLIYRPRRDKRLSWPGWLTYNGRFSHISSHPSATGRAQDRESSPAKDRRSTAVPRNHESSRLDRSVAVAAPGRQDRQVIAGQSECTAGQWSLSIALHPQPAHSLRQATTRAIPGVAPPL